MTPQHERDKDEGKLINPAHERDKDEGIFITPIHETDWRDNILTSEGAKGTTGGAARAKLYSENWPTANLDNAVEKFVGSNPIISTTDKGKRIYTNPNTGIQVVEDVNGNYFRIYDPRIEGKRAYLDLSGQVPNNKLLENGKLAGRNQSEYNQITHFNIEGK